MKKEIKKENQKNQKSRIAQAEEDVLAWWEKHDIFAKSLRARKNAKPFVFYEGPPTANGMPHPGHIMGRSFKDLFLRYKSMQGYFVERHAGWDTHGLPVEIEIEKKLGFKSKADIEKFGIAKFNTLCRESVWKYKDHWEKMTKRIGFWLDMEHPYITYENKYIETLWWIISRIFEQKLLVEDYKVMPYCARCGTGLSSHEIAQGYKTVKDKSVYVKFPIPKKHGDADKEKEYFLVWTTTPWTLPANVALAINPKLTYVKARKDGEILILAESRVKELLGDDEWDIICALPGKDLLGMKYSQLFSYIKPDRDAFFVVSGDFVSADDGSGIVHIAPAYGEDDMRVAKKNDLPILHPVKEDGEFIDTLPWSGKFVKNTDPEIIEALASKKLLFKTELYEHEYPFCWRCDTPLLYFARKGWFIKMSTLKSSLNENNQKINWIPSHIKDGRFGEWIKDVKDWAFSRNRYWGTPLPLWRCEPCNKIQTISGISDLKHKSSYKNRYFIMRHGEALFNTKGTLDCGGAKTNHLTKKGKEDIAQSILQFEKKYQDVKIDMIVHSPLLRTTETAKLVAKHFNISAQKMYAEPLLRESDFGEFDGCNIKKSRAYFSSQEERFIKPFPSGENMQDMKKRMAKSVRDLENKYKQKTIFIISHSDSIWGMETALLGWSNKEASQKKEKKKSTFIRMAEIREIINEKLPLNDDGNLDLHRPYIDAIELSCERCGSMMHRVPEICDVWFDSGCMPLAQNNLLFTQVKSGADLKKLVKQIPYPADFICEGFDQTRGWFYTLLAVSTLLGLASPYKNVIAHGHIMDKHGKKMSKSKRNYMDPMEVADMYGMDALRWYFFTVNNPGEPKRFNERDVLDSQRKSVMMLGNIYNFLSSFVSIKKTPALLPKSKNVLDKWILSQFFETTALVTRHMNAYDSLQASRTLTAFIDNLSNWYIRRSRNRFRLSKKDSDYRDASTTLSFVFENLLVLLAPFIPFATERLWQKMGKKGSIHMIDYPKVDKKQIYKKLHNEMDIVRELVSKALKQRMEASIKVRQPLLKLTIKKSLSAELRMLLADEVNVREAIVNAKQKEDVVLDIHITQELKYEGMARDLIRHIQQARKEQKLTHKDKVVLYFTTEGDMTVVMEKYGKHIQEKTIAKEIKEVKKTALKNPKEVSFDGGKFWFEIV